MYFDENNNYFYESNDNDINTIIFNRNNKMFTIEEGFNKGNMFENLYSKYKNHVYKLNVKDKKDELLLKIQMYSFAIKDVILYLDTHPTDQNMLNEYQRLINKKNELIKEYESKYNPLCSDNVNSDEKWTWINNPWPWDKGGN